VGAAGFPVTIFRGMKLAPSGALVLALGLAGCYDFHTVGPEDPPALKAPATVSVSVTYLRPSACVNTFSSCDGPVRFTASWMAIGTSVVLLPSTTAHVWTATIHDVPINYPGGQPHHVYAVDPYLFDTPTGGISARRLTMGDQPVVRIENEGGTREQGLILIDANGKGRNPPQ
jgi:hypothetical protein